MVKLVLKLKDIVRTPLGVTGTVIGVKYVCFNNVLATSCIAFCMVQGRTIVFAVAMLTAVWLVVLV